MGSGTSCCGSNGPIPKSVDQISDKKAIKQQRSKQSRNTLDSPLLKAGDTAEKNYDYGGENYEMDKSLHRIVKVIVKFNKWISTKSKIKSPQSEDYSKYHVEIENLINSIPNYSIKVFVSDCNHIRHNYHYRMNQVRQFCEENLSKKDRTCSNDNSFSMQHCFLRNKEQNKHIPLEQLTRMHAFLFHAVYICEFKVHHIHPRNAYLIACYLEKKQRILKIQSQIPSKVVHLCALYYGGKYIEDDDNLDNVTAIGLSEFIKEAMNEKNINNVWKPLDTDGSNAIDKNEIDRCLLLIVMLFVTANAKRSGCSGAPRIDKMELKELMRPIGEWMKRDKMKNKHEEITRDEFKSVLVEWLKEYHDTNGGIIADKDMLDQMLEKYKMRKQDENANECDYNRLVINCEYLQEHKSEKDVNTKDDDYDSDYDEKNGDKKLNPDAKPVMFHV